MCSVCVRMGYTPFHVMFDELYTLILVALWPIFLHPLSLKLQTCCIHTTNDILEFDWLLGGIVEVCSVCILDFIN